jgi:hypothetical protein
MKRQAEAIQFMLKNWTMLHAAIINGLKQQQSVHGPVNPSERGSVSRKIRGALKTARNCLQKHIDISDKEQLEFLKQYPGVMLGESVDKTDLLEEKKV